MNSKASILNLPSGGPETFLAPVGGLSGSSEKVEMTSVKYDASHPSKIKMKLKVKISSRRSKRSHKLFYREKKK